MSVDRYDLSTDTGRDFDYDGYSTNLATDPARATEASTATPRLCVRVVRAV